MSRKEFENWVSFYRSWPFDDYHRYQRPAALVAASARQGNLTGDSVSGMLEWLQPDPREAELSEVDKSLMRAFMRGK